MAIQLTPDAAEHVNKMLEEHENGIGLRLATKKNGCTGFSYIVDYALQIGSDDHVFESLGINIVVNKDHLDKLDGMTLDFRKNNVLNEGFDFINPNVKDVCGCGESFSV